MEDPLSIAVRFALYTDLMMLFGLALFGLYSLRGAERRSGAVLPFSPLLSATALIGLLLSAASFVLMAKNMSGASEWLEAVPHVEMMMTQTELGTIWLIRIAALVGAAVAIAFNPRAPMASLLMVSLSGGVALATLAWTGHGAMDEGSPRFWHFCADILHLWSSGGWFGALVAFALMLRPNKVESLQSVQVLSRTLSGFERAGAVIVAMIVLTGVVNYLFIVGPQVSGVVKSTYGVLLLGKLALFGLMLGLASANRFVLSPTLEQAVHRGEYTRAVRSIRYSMALELGAAVLVLGLIAWLGTLSPEMEAGM
ncbi:copper homeostasis membrane protein CopD [Pseudomonas sp. CFBP 13602]|uniref:copper homeostasis membrane protein CopD n=1 Tax=Pseudomonas sp. CFBP 13602 TaxID=2774039 RepID=UPI00177DC0DB|nr:copper homeostasis membrane protein CopD [Pseudomonas sp. CFBP 13602]MBD8825785.1 copper homeostasis membrane protein CopD [Pseudomonas sp. CFBP 13602]